MSTIRRFASVISIALVASAAHAAGFNQFVVFGDSLSDDGNISLAEQNQLANQGLNIPRRFTTNPGTVAVENIAHALGFTLAPSLYAASQPNANLNAVDYAFGGAGIMNNSETGPIPTVTMQIGGYLQAHSGQADPHALYSLWGGANDIFYHSAQLQQSTETPTQAQAAVGQAAGAEIGLVDDLQQAGARHIIVFNLPDIGQTPSAAAQGAQAQTLLSSLSSLYNGTLNAGLAGRDGIVPVDVYDLTREIMADPARYGFSNVTDPACGSNSNALLCGPQGSGAPYTYAPGAQKTYFFADGVHPTTAAHAALADAVLSELDAPGQVSLLGEAPVASADAQLRTLGRRIRTPSTAGANRVFADLGYTHQSFDATAGSPGAHSDNVDLTLGIEHPVNRHLTIGAAFGSGHASADVAHARGGYHMTTVTGAGYAAYRTRGNYVGAEIGYSHLYFNDVTRRFPIGTALRTESGNTDGNQIFGAVTAGHRFRLGHHVRSGPFGRIEWQHIRVHGYQEEGRDATAMRFGRIKHDAAIFSFGWRLSGDLPLRGRHLHPYAALAWHHDANSDPVDVTAGLKTMNGQFTLAGYNPDHNWSTANVGISADLTRRIRARIGYHGRFADQSQSLNSFEMGLRIAL